MKAHSGKLAGVAGIAILAGLSAIYWQPLVFASAVATAEKRPSLLNDAQWGKPASAQKFNKRFAAGTSESELLAWLDANHFAIDRPAKTAARKIGGLPCAEDVGVVWTIEKPGTLRSAEVSVTEAGCL